MAKKKAVRKKATKRTTKKSNKRAARKAPTKKCENCGARYHPRTAFCPKCNTANPALKKSSPMPRARKKPTKKPAHKAAAADLTITALSFVEEAGGIHQAQETLNNLKQLFGTTHD